MLDDFMNDQVTLVKANGQRFENLPASVQSKLILTQDPSIPIEDGDTFERRLPSGIVEAFEVLDAGFHEEFHGVPAHYQSKVQKRTAGTKAPPSQHIVYNLIGSNARVNIQSTDSSTNVVNVESSALFAGLREAAESSIPDSGLRAKLVEHIDGMEAAAGTRQFAERYKEFIGSAADHITVFSPFVQALTQLLV